MTHASPAATSPAGAPPLAGATAVVTGASRGIGLAVSRTLAAAGARVAMLARDERRLAEWAERLGAGALPIRCDLADPRAVRTAVDELRSTFDGAPTILVNNAGAFELAPLASVDPTSFTRTLDVNLIAPFLLTRELLPAMRELGRGHIVSIGSIADRHVFPENGAYAASKHALRALHEVLRLETRGTGVRATLVSPAPVDTPLWDPIGPDDRAGFTPRAEMLAAGDVADAVLYVVTRPPSVNIDELRLSRA